MFKSHFTVKPNQFLTNFSRSQINFTDYLSEHERFAEGMHASPYETEYHIIYPCRKRFLKEQPIDQVSYSSLTKEISILVETFEDTRVTFSSFMLTPTYLECVVKNYLNFDEDVCLEFQIETFGGMKIWVNGEEQAQFKSYIRNIPKKENVQLNFKKGTNEIVIFFDDLGERDVNYGFSIKNLSDEIISGYSLLPIKEEELRESKSILESINFQKDYYDTGEILLNLESKSDRELRIRFNPTVNKPETEMQDGNITEFKVTNKFLNIKPTHSVYSLGNVSEYQFASTTKVEFGFKLADGQYITKIIPIAIYDKSRYDGIITEKTVIKRKAEALEYYSSLELDDINVGLSRLLLNKVEKSTDVMTQPGFHSAMKLIENKGDCADFVLVPLLMFYLQHPDKVPMNFKEKLKEVSLGFRYWIDEPGNDVMWYFSENHALLFHISQYFSGYLFENETFLVSQRKGVEQYEIGKERIKEWFAHYFKYGLAEWNSVTYIPIDLIGFFSLYNAAPDKEIRKLAKEALDRIFELVSINSFQETYSSTYGRVYEHNLKSIPMNEIGALTTIAYGIGNFSDALRAAALFSFSDYEPSNELEDNFKVENQLITTYKQGINQAETYLFKTPHFSMASCQSYKYQEHGYQQHLFNVTLDKSNSSFWINNPGEYKYSGESRPSYWAGNGSMPLIYQEENVALIKYSLQEDSIPFIHLYYPYWEFAYSTQKDNWLLFGNEKSACLMYFSETPTLTTTGANAYREYIVHGKEHTVFCKCFEVNEQTNLNLEELIETINISSDNGVFRVNDNLDKYEISRNNFFVKIKN